MVTRHLAAIDSIVIHCSATPNGANWHAKDIDDWHRDKGYLRRAAPPGAKLRHIGYHFVVDIDGTLEVGRELTEVGCHAAGWNERSVGICVIGTDAFSLQQWETLRHLVVRLRGELPSIDCIIGHRNAPAQKECPGFRVMDWLLAGLLPLDDRVIAT